MPRHQMKLARFYTDVLGARLTNDRWSWGAVDPITDRVILRVWKDQLQPAGDAEEVLVLRPAPTSGSLGYPERKRHLALIEQGAAAFGVVCTSRHTHDDAEREISSYDDRELLILGAIVDRPDGRYAQIAGRVPVAEMNRPISAAVELEADLRAILRSRSLGTTEREALVSARIGQGSFRTRVLARWNGRCAVTGSATLEVIRASHIKPWRECDSHERLDPDNGLPLVADLDALFDSRLITFDESGRMLVSPRVSQKERGLLRLEGRRLTKVPEGRTLAYLAAHRDEALRTRW